MVQNVSFLIPMKGVVFKNINIYPLNVLHEYENINLLTVLILNRCKFNVIFVFNNR